MKGAEQSTGAEGARRQYCFAEFTLDLGEGFLRRGGEEVTLSPKAFEVLAYVVEHHGRLVTKAALIEAVWPDTAITDNSLAQRLMEIRRALSDDSQHLIRTVARRGYVFAASVTSLVIEFPRQPAGQTVAATLPEPSDPGQLLQALAASRRAWFWTIAGVGVAICIGTVWWLATTSSPGIRPGDRQALSASIVVLPFVNLGSGTETGHLGDGITEDITNTLATVPGLRVIARSAALRFKSGKADLRDASRQLGVSTALEGSVRQIGDRLRITAQLVNTVDGYVVWSDSYDRGAADLIAIQMSIAQAVASNLRLTLPASQRADLFRPRTLSIDAYNLVLKGRYLDAGAADPDGRVNCYRRALEYDPNYSEAYSGIAGEWLRRAMDGSVAPRQVMPNAQAAVTKALQLDDTLADAHFLSAMVKWTYEWDWSGADREFIRALQLNPNSAPMRVQYARYLALLGRRQEALTQLDEIRALDPASTVLMSMQAAVYFFTGDYDRTIRHGHAVLAGEPELWAMHFWLGRAYEAKGRLPEAIVALETWHRIPGRLQGRGFGMLASTYARAGRKADALRLLDRALTTSKQSHVSPASVTLIYIGLGDHVRALDWLEKAYEERDHSLVTLKADPAYNPLRGNPKFAALLRRVKLE